MYPKLYRHSYISVKQKAIHELRLYCWKRGNQWGIQPFLSYFPKSSLITSSPWKHDCSSFLFRSCITWRSPARLWATSLTAVYTCLTQTSSSTSAPSFRRINRTCYCELELSLMGICVWDYMWIPFIPFLWFSSFVFFPFPYPPCHDFCFLTQSSDIRTMGKLVHLGCTV